MQFPIITDILDCNSWKSDMGLGMCSPFLNMLQIYASFQGLAEAV